MKALRNAALALVIFFVLTAVPAMAGANPIRWRGEWCPPDNTWYLPADAPGNCLGEGITFVGCLSQHGQGFVDEAGNLHGHTHSHMNARGYSDSGLEYRVTMTDNSMSFEAPLTWEPPPGPQWHWTGMNKHHYIGKGKAPNFIVNILEHYTVNAKGESTATVNHYSFECHP